MYVHNAHVSEICTAQRLILPVYILGNMKVIALFAPVQKLFENLTFSTCRVKNTG